MIVGCLGDLIFQVSSDTVMTVSNFVESASTRYAIHQRHNNSACLEYTGMDPDQLTFTDLRNYIKRRVAYAKYRVGNTYIKTDLSDVAVLPNGTVRAQLTISAESTPLTVTRVELYNSDNALWAHQDCSITVNTGQTGILYWFDFTVTEQEVK